MSATNGGDGGGGSGGSGGPFLVGIDGGTESVRAGVFGTDGRALAFAATPYGLSHSRPGWAEQDPDEWWSSLIQSVRGAVEKAGVRPEEIAGIPVDCTTCTVVALDERGRHVRPAIIWMEVRASEQARAIGESTHPARKYNGGGSGPVSAEWYPSKALRLKQNETDNYRQTTHLVEYTDWLNWRLTGRWTANINTASIRASYYYDRAEGGWPEGFYREIGLDDVLDKLPPEVVDLGEPVEGLAERPAAELGLRPRTPVAQGGADAFVAQIGLGVVHPGSMALITGSSHVLVGQSDHATSREGFFGAYTDAVVPGQYTVEGGQVSTVSVLKWFKDNFCAEAVREVAAKGMDPYDLLNERPSKLPVGSDGLIVNEYWQAAPSWPRPGRASTRTCAMPPTRWSTRPRSWSQTSDATTSTASTPTPTRRPTRGCETSFRRSHARSARAPRREDAA